MRQTDDKKQTANFQMLVHFFEKPPFLGNQLTWHGRLAYGRQLLVRQNPVYELPPLALDLLLAGDHVGGGTHAGLVHAAHVLAGDVALAV